VTAHLVQADAIAGRAAPLLAGDRVVWREALDGGPASGAPGSDEWLDARAAYLTRPTQGERAPEEFVSTRAALAEQEAALARLASSAGDVILWLGNDLVCLLHELHWLTRLREHGAAGRLARVAPPDGEARCLLEQGDALAARFAGREPVTPDEAALAARAFGAFTAADPSRLGDFLADEAAARTRAGRALALHRERFPAPGSGLGLVEEVVLGALAGGASSLVELMAPVGAALPGYCITDERLWEILQRLADPGCPLVEIAAGPWTSAPLALTGLAGEVRAGRRDFAAECDVTTWLGGVELGPGRTRWRYDRDARALVAV
jgi:hypothetical protein